MLKLSAGRKAGFASWPVTALHSTSAVLNSHYSLLEAGLKRGTHVIQSENFLSLNWLFMCQTHLLGFICEDFSVSTMVTFCGGPGVWVLLICILRAF